MPKSNKPSKDDITRKAIMDAVLSLGMSAREIAKCSIPGKMKTHYGVVSEDGIRIFVPESGGVKLVDWKQWSDIGDGHVDHFATRSEFKFQTWNLTTLERGKVFASAIQGVNAISLKTLPRPFWRKILGFRSKTKWKMTTASIFYALLIMVILSKVFGNDGTSQGTNPAPSNGEAATSATNSVVATTSSVSNPSNGAATTSDANATTQKATAVVPWVEQSLTKNTVLTEIQQHLIGVTLSHDFGYPKDIVKVQVLDDQNASGRKIINVYYKPDQNSVWNENDLVKQSIGTAVETFQTLFQNPKVSSVTMYTMVDMQDQYGNTNTEQGVRIEYDKATADKINWLGFEDRVLTQPADALNIATNYFIHPGIYKNVSLDGLYSASGGTGQ